MRVNNKKKMVVISTSLWEVDRGLRVRCKYAIAKLKACHLLEGFPLYKHKFRCTGSPHGITAHITDGRSGKCLSVQINSFNYLSSPVLLEELRTLKKRQYMKE